MLARRRMIRPFAALLLIASASLAQDRPKLGSDVIDGAGMFSNEAIRTTKEAMGRLERERKVALTVETVPSLRGQEINEVALRRAEQLDHQGVFVLIAKEERKIEILASPRALREQLGKERLGTIREAILDEFRKKQVNEGLIRSVKATEDAIASALPPSSGSKPAAESSTAATGASSSSASSSLVLRQQSRLTLAGARKALAGAEARAAKEGWKMNISVVDDGGHLIAFGRMDEASPAHVALANTRAVNAATYRNGGGLDRSTANVGGVAIVVDGQVIGGIGVAGGSAEQDGAAAQAGVAALLAAIKDGNVPREEKSKPSTNDGSFEFE